MLDDPAPDTHAAEPLSRLVRARAARRRAEAAEEKARRDLALSGVNGRVVDLAMALLDNGIRASVEEHRAAQALLKAMHAPVQIELAEFYTSPDALTDGRAQDIARSEGYYARMEGASRTCRARNEAERRAWMAGWDEADADINADPEPDPAPE